MYGTAKVQGKAVSYSGDHPLTTGITAAKETQRWRPEGSELIFHHHCHISQDQCWPCCWLCLTISMYWALCLTLHSLELIANRVPVPWCSSHAWQVVVRLKVSKRWAQHSFVQLPVPQQGEGPGWGGRWGKTQTCLCHPGFQSQSQHRAYTHIHHSINSHYITLAVYQIISEILFIFATFG